MKKKIIIFLITLFIPAAYVTFRLLGPAAHPPTGKFLYIKTGTTLSQLHQKLKDEGILSTLTWFHTAEKLIPIKTIKPGKYKITNGMSVLQLLRMIRNGKQTPVQFVITKLRTKEQLAAKMGRLFEFDSTAAIRYLCNNDSFKKYGLDTNTLMAAALPLTYENKWNTTPAAVFEKLYTAYKIFWTPARMQQAQTLGLSPIQVTTLASIVDEETNAATEKGFIASTYLNRIQKGIPLQADPAVKFALKDFSIKRIIFKHLEVNSPYNTYRNRGLPPGPICTPQGATVDAVLQAPTTAYLYFVASPKFDGTHLFSTNYQDHLRLAKEYQAALNTHFGTIQPKNQ